jgi:hypothetical protein
MILKIERYVDQDWWMLDDIRKISKSHFEQPFDKDFESGEADIFILDYDDHLRAIPVERIPDSRDVIRLICRLSDGSEFCVLFDTMAYLLNDTGKTIEKIVANYR